MRRTTALALLSCALIATGCGSDSSNGDEPEEAATPTAMEEIEVPEGPFETTDDLVAAADGMCEQSNTIFDRAPMQGINFAGVSAEFALDHEKALALAGKLGELEAPDEIADTFGEYIDLITERAENYDTISQVAADEDEAALTDAYDKDLELFKERGKLAKKIGFQECGSSDPIEVSADGTGTGPEEGLEYPEPSETVEEAAQAWLDADRTGDCKEAVDLSHSQSGFVADSCEFDKPFFDKADLAGTEQYGPVGVATYDAGKDFVPSDNYFVVDTDGGFKFAGSAAVYTGGIRPANEGADSDDVVNAAVEAIRANDDDAFNETLSVDSPPEGNAFEVKGKFDTFGTDDVYGPLLVEDIRADEEATVEPLGLGIAQGFYLLTANDHQYTLNTRLEPGSEDEYAFNGFYGLFEAK